MPEQEFEQDRLVSEEFSHVLIQYRDRILGFAAEIAANFVVDKPMQRRVLSFDEQYRQSCAIPGRPTLLKRPAGYAYLCFHHIVDFLLSRYDEPACGSRFAAASPMPDGAPATNAILLFMPLPFKWDGRYSTVGNIIYYDHHIKVQKTHSHRHLQATAVRLANFDSMTIIIYHFKLPCTRRSGQNGRLV